MSFDPVPWLVGGGAEHSPEVGRLLAHVATGGASGVGGVSDLKVTSLPVAGGAVRIGAGACLIPNRYAGTNPQQSYVGRAPTATDVTITPTGSASGRSDLIVVRIDDPQYGGATPADPKVGPYIRAEVISNVGPSASGVPSGITYPAIALARIDIPASTGTITQAMITDLRHLAQPRRDRHAFGYSSTQGWSTGPVDPMNDFNAKVWPSGASWNVLVPSWATRATVRIDVGNYAVKGGDSTGEIFAAIGSVSANRYGSWDENMPSSNSYRSSVSALAIIDIPEAMRGTVQPVKAMAFLTGGPGYIDSDEFTNTFADVEFQEAPV